MSSKWTKKKLEQAGYTVENALIEGFELSMANHNCLTFALFVKAETGICSVFSTRKLGTGSLGSDYFDSDEKAMVFIMKVMDTVGVENLTDLKGKYIRVPFKNDCSQDIIGNILHDDWLDLSELWDTFDEEKRKYWKEYNKKYGKPVVERSIPKKKRAKKATKKKEETKPKAPYKEGFTEDDQKTIDEIFTTSIPKPDVESLPYDTTDSNT